MKRINNNMQITITIIIVVIAFFSIFWAISLANASFTFKIDERTENAINDLSKFSNATTININNYYGNKESCINGCKMSFDKIANSPNTIAIDGFYKSNCTELCSESN